jgi:hypothetical protein
MNQDSLAKLVEYTAHVTVYRIAALRPEAGEYKRGFTNGLKHAVNCILREIERLESDERRQKEEAIVEPSVQDDGREHQGDRPEGAAV